MPFRNFSCKQAKRAGIFLERSQDIFEPPTIQTIRKLLVYSATETTIVADEIDNTDNRNGSSDKTGYQSSITFKRSS